MLCTVKAVILPSARRADGTWNVKIRITYDRRSRWLATPVYVTQAQLTRSYRLKDATAAMNAERHVQAVRSALAELPPFWLEGRTVDDVVAWLRSRLGRGAFRLDIVAFGRGVAATKGEGTRRAYEVALNSFARHVGRDAVDVSEVTRAVAQEWADGLSAESAPGYVSKLRHVWEQARLRYNDEHAERVPASPFSRLALPVAVHRGQRSLGVEAMQRLIDARTDDPAERRALDWFVLSFGLMGMNYIDLLGAAPPKGGVLAYERRKTRSRRADGAEMRVRVPDCLGPFVARQRARGGRWWLRAPRDGNEQVLANAINARLKEWAEREGLEPFTFYAARHTWATVARSAECGVPYPVIEDCLNHKAQGLLDIYAERDWRTLDEANARVLALFRWPTD